MICKEILEAPESKRLPLAERAEALIKQVLRARLGPVPVYLFGSRARGQAQRASDFDLWIDAEVPAAELREIRGVLADSIVPWRVDMVTTAQLQGEFGRRVRLEAVPWL